MSELQVIRTALAKAAQRRRWQRALNGLFRGLLFGGIVWLLVLVIYKLFPLREQILIGAAAVAVVALLAGFVHGWMRKMTLQETARWLDEQQHLQERLSTALEVASADKNENWRTLLIADAAQFAAKLDPRRLMPFQLPRASRWGLLVLILSAAVGFVPEYRSKEFLEKKQDAAAIKETGAKLVELTKHNLEHRQPLLEPTRKALETVEQLGLQLGKNPVTRNEALKDLANVSDKLKEQMKEMAKNPALKSLERAARESSKNGGTTPGDLQKQIDALQKELGKGANPASLDRLKSELQQAQKAAASMPKDSDSPEAAAAKQKMAQTLSDLAKQAREMGQQMPNLDDAIAALQAGQTDQFLKDLDAATTDMEKLQEMSKALQQLQQQADHMGKDLPEQLKFGQVEAAQKSLEKMMDQLKSANLSQKELKKMLDEISRSVDPASPYGKAAEFLKQSVGQAQKGQKSDAAQSLADAAKELQKAMDQMQDAQALAASLEALKKAEYAIATRKPWGECPYCGRKGGR